MTKETECLFDLIAHYKLSGQNTWEIRSFLESVTNELKPKRTIELGVYWGSNTCLLSSVTEIITIGVDNCYQYKNNLLHKNLHFLIGDTGSPTTVEAAKKLLGGEQIDLLFIDADHTYDSVKKDFQLWSPLVRPGGWIAFHDIDPQHVSPEICQVNKFWKELVGEKVEYIFGSKQSEEGIQGQPHFGGIGVLKTMKDTKSIRVMFGKTAEGISLDLTKVNVPPENIIKTYSKPLIAMGVFYVENEMPGTKFYPVDPSFAPEAEKMMKALLFAINEMVEKKWDDNALIALSGSEERGEEYRRIGCAILEELFKD